jgi:hypothetical protein
VTLWFRSDGNHQQARLAVGLETFERRQRSPGVGFG